MVFIDGDCTLQTAREISLTLFHLLNLSMQSVVLGQPAVLPSISTNLGGFFYFPSFSKVSL